MEGEATHRAIRLAELAGTPLYVVHLSAAEALAAVVQARDQGLPVYAETCPHYLFLTVADYDRPGFEGAKYVMTPPLRTPAHQEALWRGLRTDDLQVVSTDHCPFCLNEQPYGLKFSKAQGRNDFSKIPNGAPGVATRLPLIFDGGVKQHGPALTRFGALPAPAEYVAGVEQAYRMHGEGRFVMEPKGHIVLDKYPGEWEAMPSYIAEPEAAACKWVSIREQNRERFDLPTVFSILIYTHPETGFPLAICDGSHHTVMRTGAAAAVSAKWMARPDSEVLAIVGAGNMAEGALETCATIFAWREVRVWSRTQPTLDEFVANQQRKHDGFEIRASTDLEQTVR